MQSRCFPKGIVHTSPDLQCVEAIHMLVGAMKCNCEQDPIINICDSAGKSNLVFGLSRLLNILLYPRVRSHHLKLWGTEI